MPKIRPRYKRKFNFEKFIDCVELRAYRVFRLTIFLYGLFELFKHEIGR